MLHLFGQYIKLKETLTAVYFMQKKKKTNQTYTSTARKNMLLYFKELRLKKTPLGLNTWLLYEQLWIFHGE